MRGRWGARATLLMMALSAAPALADLPKVAVIVEGPKAAGSEVDLAIRSALQPQAEVIDPVKVRANMPKTKGPLRDVVAGRLRRVLDAKRVVVVTLKRRKAGQFQVTVRGVDESGVVKKTGYSM